MSGCATASGLVPGMGGDDSDEGGGEREVRFDRMVVIEPAEGVAEVEAMKPPWCDQVEASGTGGALKRKMMQVKEKHWARADVTKVVANLCLKPDDPDFQQQTAYYLQAFVNLTGFDPAQAVASIRARVDKDKKNADLEKACASHRVGEEAHEVQRQVAGTYRSILGCGRRDLPAWLQGTGEGIGWHLDGNPENPSEILLAYHVLDCLPDPYGELEPRGRLAFAACGWDAVGLKKERLEKEIESRGYEGYAAAVVREHHARARLVANSAKERAFKIAGKDKEWNQVMVKGPNTAFTGWNNLYKKNKEAMQAALAFENDFFSPSRAKVEGCGETLRGHFFDYVKGKNPKKVSEAAGAATDMFGYQLLLRLVLCEGAEGNPLEARVLGLLAESDVRAVRGPREAAYFYTLGDIKNARKTRPRFPVEPTDVPNASSGGVNLLSEARRVWGSYNDLHHKDMSGVVKSVKRDGDEVVVTFRTDTFQTPTYSCKKTNRIKKIEDGRVIYEKNCRQSGTRTVDRTPAPIRVRRPYAAGLRRGSLVSFRRESGKGPGRAMPLAVWKSKRGKRLVAYHGAQL